MASMATIKSEEISSSNQIILTDENFLEFFNISTDNIIFLFDMENVRSFTYSEKLDIFCSNFLYFLNETDKIGKLDDLILVFFCKYIDQGCNKFAINQMQQSIQLLLNKETIPIKIIESTILPNNIGELFKYTKRTKKQSAALQREKEKIKKKGKKG